MKKAAKKEQDSKKAATMKAIRRRTSNELTQLGHVLSPWVHSPGGTPNEAVIKCRRCCASGRVNLRTGATVHLSDKPCKSEASYAREVSLGKRLRATLAHLNRRIRTTK